MRKGLKAAVAAVLASGAAAAAGLALAGGGGRTSAPPQADPPGAGRMASAPAPTTTVPVPPPTYIATLSAPAAYADSPGGPAAGTLAATNPFGAPQVLAVIGTPDQPGWLHVELPVRPNGSTGWIPTAGVTLSQTSYRVAVDLAARTLTVTDSGRAVLTTPVAVGTPSTPTPADSTYLWELIRPDNPNGAYGPYIFGLAEFSDTYSVFNGGDAQIGIHGQDEPWSIGQAASHGCVRLPNDVITTLAGMLPLGTPVTIG